MPTQFDTQVMPAAFTFPRSVSRSLKPWVEIYINYRISIHPENERLMFVARIDLRGQHYDWGHRYNHLNGTTELLWDWKKQCKRSCRRSVAITSENRGLDIDADIIRDLSKCIFINTDKHGHFPHHRYWEHANRPRVFGPPNEVIEEMERLSRVDRYRGRTHLRCSGPGGIIWIWNRENNSYTHETPPGEGDRARTISYREWGPNDPVLGDEIAEVRRFTPHIGLHDGGPLDIINNVLSPPPGVREDCQRALDEGPRHPDHEHAFFDSITETGHARWQLSLRTGDITRFS